MLLRLVLLVAALVLSPVSSQECEAGQGLIPGTDKCTLCVPGLYNDGSFDTCMPCEVGTFSDAMASTDCTPCPEGSVAGTTGSDTCTDCGDGAISESGLFCTDCPSGRFQIDTPESTRKGTPVMLTQDGVTDSSREVPNLRADINAVIGPVVEMVLTTSTNLNLILTDASALVLPEQERGKFPFTTIQLVDIVAAVNDGMNLVVAGDGDGNGAQSINDMFRLGWASLGASCHSSTTFGRTPIGDEKWATSAAPSTLEGHDAVWCLSGTSVPEGDKLYLTTHPFLPDGNVGVAQAPMGQGTVTFIGYDWFLDPGTDWQYILGAAMGSLGTGTGNTCAECPSGRFQPDTGSSGCETCAAGRYSEAGADDCTECPAGTFGEGGFCQACPIGTFQDDMGETECKTCSSALFTGMASCPFDCEDNIPHIFYSEDIDGLVTTGYTGLAADSFIVGYHPETGEPLYRLRSGIGSELQPKDGCELRESEMPPLFAPEREA